MNRKFPWGEVVKVHDIAGKYQITEYICGVNSTHSTARLTHWSRRCCRLCATTTTQKTVTCSATLTHWSLGV